MYSFNVNDDNVRLRFYDIEEDTIYIGAHSRVNRLLSSEARQMIDQWVKEGRSAAMTAQRLLSFVDITGLRGTAYRVVAVDLATRIADLEDCDE